MRRLASLLLFVVAFAGAAAAVEPGEALKDPAQEARARAISQELRCLVCQNESIDDSEAPLARDLRRIVRERIAAGDSDEEVLDYVVARYGDFVLLRPRLSPMTWLLWFGPFLAVIAGAAAIYVYLRRRAVAPAAAPLSPEEEARLREVTDGLP